MTPLDQAHAAMLHGSETDALRFYQLLADATLFLLLEHEAEGERINPRVFDLPDGPVLLAYDTEERMASLGQGPVPYAALPGRIIAQHLAGQGVALGLNFGTDAPSETLLPPEALSFLAERLGADPTEVEARPTAFHPPATLPPSLTDALGFTLAAASGLAEAALLAGVTYSDGRRGHMLALIEAVPAAQDALARAVAEALAFSGLDAGEIDVTFLSAEDPALGPLARVAQAFDIPAPAAPPEPKAPEAPGSNPARPPILR